MNNYALEQAEELFEQALEYFLGIEKMCIRDRN